MNIEPQRIGQPADLKHIPRERWATVLGMVFVQQTPLQGLQGIVLAGKRKFLKDCKKHDVVGLKPEDYSDIFDYITLAVQRYHRSRVALKRAYESELDA